MLRLTGAALILGAALRLQRSLSVRGRLRRKTLRALANAFLSLESAVRSTLTPLPALLQELRCESEAASFFADVTAGLARGEPLTAAWEGAVKNLPVGTRERETVCALSRSLNGEEESVCAARARADCCRRGTAPTGARAEPHHVSTVPRRRCDALHSADVAL